MTKFYLISLSEKRFLQNAGDRPPLGILYIAASLIKNFHRVKVCDLNHTLQDDMLTEIKRFNPDYVGINFTTPQHYQANHLARIIKKTVNAKFIAGGVHPTILPNTIHEIFDYVIQGEGENVILNLHKKGKRIRVGGRVTKLNSLPLPARHLLDMNNYNLIQEGKETATLITSRGCKGKCVFCNRIMGKKFRYHSPRYVIDELKTLIYRYNYHSFYFLDDTFTTSQKRVHKICRLIKEELPKIKFRVTTRVDKVGYDLLRIMKEAGLELISLGIEHTNNNILKKMGKGTTIEKAVSVVAACHELGIKVKGFFIINPPHATPETAYQCLQWAIDHKLDDADFYPLVAYPGTAIWNFPYKFNMRLLNKDFKFFQASKDKKFKINIDSKVFSTKQVRKVAKDLRHRWWCYKYG